MKRGHPRMTSFFYPDIFLRDLLHLHIVQLYRRRTTEDLHRHLSLFLLIIYFLDDPIEIVERPLDDLDRFTDNERLAHAHTTGLRHLIHLTQHLIHLRLPERDRVLLPKEMNDTVRIFDDLTQIVPQLPFRYLHHHISRIIVALPHYFFPVLHFIHLLYRQKYLLHDLSPSATGNFLVQVLFYLTLLPTHDPKDIPFGFRRRLTFRLGLGLLLIQCLRHKNTFIDYEPKKE